MNSQVVRPTVPYRGTIPGGLDDGKMIEIRGSVPYGAHAFSINLLTGLDAYSDHALHLNVRFNERTVIRNSKEMNNWGHEERHGTFPFHSGREFTIMILADSSSYKIAVDSQHCWEFVHRIAMMRVTSIHIEGSVNIERIEFVGRHTTGRPATTCTVPPSIPSVIPPPAVQICPQGPSNLAPVYNPIIPYAYPIYGGLRPGMMAYISGRPSASAYKFSMNFQSGTAPYPPPDIAFHCDVRFFNNTVIRNSRSSNTWSREETLISHFPFQMGVNFDIIVRIEADRFMVAINGSHFIEFKHRLTPLSRFDTLYIDNDVVISSIRFA